MRGKGERKNVLLLVARVTNVLLLVRIRALSARYQLKLTGLVRGVCTLNICTILYSSFMAPEWGVSPLKFLKNSQGFCVVSRRHWTLHRYPWDLMTKPFIGVMCAGLVRVRGCHGSHSFKLGRGDVGLGGRVEALQGCVRVWSWGAWWRELQVMSSCGLLGYFQKCCCNGVAHATCHCSHLKLCP